MQIIQVALTKILPPSFDQRTSTDEQADQELLDSIKQFGVMEPILVRPKGPNFEIIAGYRRFRAATRAGLPTIPCISQKSDDKETEILKVHENIHRLPLSHVDQGNTFRYLRDTFNMSETEIAALVGKSVPYISQHLTLVNSDPDIIAAVKAEEISYSASRSLIQVENPDERKRLLNIVRENGATIPVLEKWVREANRPVNTQNYGISLEPDALVPPYTGDPTFPCEGCDTITPIKNLNIVRLCPGCHYSFKSAIQGIRDDSSSKNP